MAERRMFTQKIVDSDAFLDMPLSTQALYFHLNMRADDDGFVNNPKKIQRMICASDDDLKLLIAKRFLLAFESGVVVIKHWRMHNLLRKDRYNPTQYQEYMNQLLLKDNGAYTETVEITAIPEPGNQMATTWQPDDNQMATQDSIGKDSIVKDNNIINNTMCNSAEPDHAKSPSKKDIDTLFEAVWKLYPSKKGKGQVSDAKKKKLYEIGYDELARAIDRYKKDLQRDAEWRKPQNGSTFFNSGFIDYLDKNYEEPPKVVTSSNKTATELSQFYDMAAEWAEGGNQDE